MTTPPPTVSPPWVCTWDQANDTWLFSNMMTGERTFTYNAEIMNSGSRGFSYEISGNGVDNGFQRSLSSTSPSIEQAPDYVAYGAGAAVEEANTYKNNAEDATEGMKDSVGGWFSCAAEVVGGKIAQGLEEVVGAPEAAAQAIGESVGDVQHFGEDIGDAVIEVPEKVAGDVDEAVDNMQRFGDDVGDAVTQVSENAMRKVDEGVKDVQEVGEDVQGYGDGLGAAYEQGRGDERAD